MWLDNRRITIQPYFDWREAWVLWRYDSNLDVLYIQLLPCVGIRLYIAGEKTIDRRRPSEERESE